MSHFTEFTATVARSICGCLAIIECNDSEMTGYIKELCASQFLDDCRIPDDAGTYLLTAQAEIEHASPDDPFGGHFQINQKSVVRI